MAIWYSNDISLEQIQEWGKSTMSAHIGIEFTEIGDDFIRATMPVDHRTQQPFKILHGGASAALAETIGSVASALVINRQKFRCVGIEINLNHIKSIQEGIVIATCKPLHIGRLTHVWDIKITDESTKLIAVSRLTVAVIEKKEKVN